MIHPHVQPNLEPASQEQGRQPAKDDDQTQLPTVNNTQDAAGQDVEHGNDDEADVETHQLKDRLRIGVDSARQCARVVIGAVKEL